MKSITVKEASEALGISTRAVLLRREKGALKGFLTTNARGSEEYRIYPTKEIMEGLRAIGSPLVASLESDNEFDIVDVSGSEMAAATTPIATAVADRSIDVTEELPNNTKASTYGDGDTVTPSPEHSSDWAMKSTRAAAANGMAEDLWNNIISKFVNQLGEKDRLIGQMQSEIQEKDRQLLLLPDKEAIAKKAEEAIKLAEVERVKAEAEVKRAEAERKNAEVAQLEVVALQKQIGFLQDKIATNSTTELEQQLEEEKRSKQAELAKLESELEETRRSKEQEVKALEERLIAAEDFRKASEASQAKLSELQRALEERSEADQAKASETALIKEQLEALSKKLEDANKPWWKKIIGA